MQVFVNRPIMALAINLVWVIIGAIAFSHLPLRHASEIPQDKLTIETRYRGAPSAVIEQRITKPLENTLSGIDGLKHITSKSFDDLSEIYVEFRNHKSFQKSFSEVRDRVLGARALLPKESEIPVIYERSDDENTLMYLVIQDDERNNAQIFDYLRRNVIESLKMIDGVAEVGDFGGEPYVIEVQVEPAQLAQYRLSLQDIQNALRREKANVSGGEMDTRIGKKTLVVTAPFLKPADLGKIVLLRQNDFLIRIQDVAEVRLSQQSSEFRMRVDGIESVGLWLRAKMQSNPMEVSKKVSEYIQELQPKLPTSMHISVLFDRTKTFRAAIQSVYGALWEAIFLVGVIVTLSLASLRAATVPLITVPLCLITTFSLMWAFGFSINPITLLAMVLAVGLVVDDAIVVLENIHRQMETGLTALEAARKGISEIAFAVLVMTVTLVAVYLPVAFQGNAQAIPFREFAWTLAGSVLVSGFVALTLTPAMCGRILVKTKGLDQDSASERFWKWLSLAYQRRLTWIMRHSFKVLFGAVCVVIFGAWTFTQLPSELKPFEDEDLLFGWMGVENAVPKNVVATWHDALESTVQKIAPEVDRVMEGTWRNQYFYLLFLSPRQERAVDSVEIAKRLEEPLKKIPGPQVGINVGMGGIGGSSDQLQMMVRYAGDRDFLLQKMKAVVDALEKVEGIARVTSPETVLKQRYQVRVLREVAAQLGIRMEDIESVLMTYFSGQKALDFTFDGFDYDVRVTAQKDLRSELNSINQFFVLNPDGVQIPLGTLVDIQPELSAEYIGHKERMLAAKLEIQMKPGTSMGALLPQVKEVLKAHLPNDALIDYSGVIEEYQRAERTMWAIFGLALAFIYLVLAALFESVVDPFIVLLTVPLSIVGAAWSVRWMGGSNNIYTQMGIVTLMGLISKHGILITDFANRLHARGQNAEKAVMEAATARLRPILMTTLAMVGGAVPLVYSVGAGAQARHHLGWVMIGGMLSGTLFSLFVIPVVYALFAKVRRTRL